MLATHVQNGIREITAYITKKIAIHIYGVNYISLILAFGWLDLKHFLDVILTLDILLRALGKSPIKWRQCPDKTSC